MNSVCVAFTSELHCMYIDEPFTDALMLTARDRIRDRGSAQLKPVSNVRRPIVEIKGKGERQWVMNRRLQDLLLVRGWDPRARLSGELRQKGDRKAARGCHFAGRYGQTGNPCGSLLACASRSQSTEEEERRTCLG